MNFVDPSGLHLWPWQKRVYVEGGTAEEREQVQQALRRIFSTKRGRELEQIIRAEAKARTIYIISYQGKNECPNAPSTEIDISPNAIVSYDTEWGTIQFPLEVIIAHELGHAVAGTRDDGPGQMNNINKNENPIAKDLGWPGRVSY